MDEFIKYSNYNKLNYNKKVNCFLIILISLIIIICVTFCYVKYTFYYYNKSVVSILDDKFYIKMFVLESDLDKIIDNNTLVHNEKEYEYNLIYISDVIVDNNYNKFYEVYINSNINNNINNSIYDIKIKYKEEKIIKIIKDYLKKGV